MREGPLRNQVGQQLAKLREPAVQRNVLLLVAVGLLAAILLPLRTSPELVFAFSAGEPKWASLMWPVIAGGAYLFVAAAPAEAREKVPSVVLQWLPFAVSFLGVFMMSRGGGGGGDSGGFAGDSLYILGYATLVFGLLSRVAHPHDQITRIIVAIGAGMLIPGWIDMLGALRFAGMPALLIIVSILHFAVTSLAIACLLILVPAEKLPPALQAIETFAPLVATILILWLPTMVVSFAIIMLVHYDAGGNAVVWLFHALINIVAFFGVLFMTSPGAYEGAKAMLAGDSGPPSPPQPGGGSQ
jgi:hypothetical protein